MDENTSEKQPEAVGKMKLRPIEDEMQQSYLDYAMSVIVGRALPDTRDGLKPVHRRILYAMHGMGMLHNKPFKKSARIVGEVLGKYHPHGDTAVYDALVRMAQDFSLRYPLINGHGNFGSVDGDRAAAMRYSEARLARIAEELLADIEKETVKFVPNFDESLKEPSVLPARLPNLLINGSAGIAVGMACNIPPHNVQEVCNAISHLIDHPDATYEDIMQFIKGPDFPTSGSILGNVGIRLAYKTGQGRIIVRARAATEEHADRERIIVSEIPYMVNKAMLIEQMADLVKAKTIPDIADLRDESDREGMRIVIELKRGANSDVVLNQLFKHSRLQVTFGINMLALVNSEPKTLGIVEMLGEFIKHRFSVIRARTQYDLRKAEEKAHILEGLKTALDHIDPVVALIKAARSVDDARRQLMSGYPLTEIQASAILDMKLARLTNLEQDKLRQELEETHRKITEYKSILASEEKIYTIIREDCRDIAATYGDGRRTVIEEGEFENDIDIEDLIEKHKVVVTITGRGYIKRLPLATYREQNRGGRGIIGTDMREGDFVDDLFVCNSHSSILFFTDKGRVHWKKVYGIPEGSRHAKGKAIVNLIGIRGEEKVTAAIPVTKFDDQHYLMMVTRKGIVKKTNLSLYSRPRQGGIRAIILEDGDELIKVMLTDGNQNILIASANGLAVKFREQDARPIGRTAKGVIGIRLRGNDYVVGACVADDSRTLLTITANGYGKRSSIADYRLISRGGSGVINIKCSERNSRAVAALSVDEEDEVLLMSRLGILIRMRCHGVSVIGRNTQGVRLMRLSQGDSVVSAARVVKEEAPEDERPEEDRKELLRRDAAAELEKERKERIYKETAMLDEAKEHKESMVYPTENGNGGNGSNGEQEPEEGR